MRSQSLSVLALLPWLVTACAEEAGAPVPTPAPVEVAAPDAPSEPAADALPEARALVERFLAVTKYDVLRRSQSRHEKATLTLPVGKGTVESFSRRPDASRQVTTLGDFGSFESGLTGGRAWAVLPGNVAMLLEGVELLQARVEGAYEAHSKPSELVESLRTLGRTTWEGVACYEVEVVARAEPGMDAAATLKARTSREFYEVESGFLRGQVGYAEGEIAKGPYLRLYEDYREFSGLFVPTRTTLRQDPIEVVTTLESLALDTVKDEDLAPPRAIQRQLEAEAEPEDGAESGD